MQQAMDDTHRSANCLYCMCNKLIDVVVIVCTRRTRRAMRQLDKSNNNKLMMILEKNRRRRRRRKLRTCELRTGDCGTEGLPPRTGEDPSSGESLRAKSFSSDDDERESDVFKLVCRSNIGGVAAFDGLRRGELVAGGVMWSSLPEPPRLSEFDSGELGSPEADRDDWS